MEGWDIAHEMLQAMHRLDMTLELEHALSKLSNDV